MDVQARGGDCFFYYGGSIEILSSEASPIFWKAPDRGLGLTTFDAWRSQKSLRVVFSCFLWL